jgi:hypothetical protein
MWDDRIRVVGYQHAELPQAADFPHQVRRSDLLKHGAVRLVTRRAPAREYKVVREVVDVDFGPLTAGTAARSQCSEHRGVRDYDFGHRTGCNNPIAEDHRERRSAVPRSSRDVVLIQGFQVVGQNLADHESSHSRTSRSSGALSGTRTAASAARRRRARAASSSSAGALTYSMISSARSNRYSFSSRFSSLTNRQSIPSAMIFWGLDLIIPASCMRRAKSRIVSAESYSRHRR